MDQIAVLHEFADQRIDLVQAKRELRLPLEIATDKVVLVHTHVEGCGTGIINHCRPELLSQRQHAEDAAHTDLSLAPVDGLAEGADVCASVAGARQ